MCEFSPVAWRLSENGLRQDYNLRCNRVCPRIAKTKFRGSFFGGEFCCSFNGGAKWITHHERVFPVGVVDAPELLARLRSHGRAHAGSSPQAGFVKMCQLHKMRGQSVCCPGHGHGKIEQTMRSAVDEIAGGATSDAGAIRCTGTGGVDRGDSSVLRVLKTFH